jgi:CRISPR-associated protein Cas5h
MLAAVAGVRRDGYYDVFAEGKSAVAIEPVGSLRTVTVPSLGLGTNPDESFASAGGTGRKTVKVYYPDGTENRQIHSYHHLVDPAYRVDVAVEDDLFYDTLASQLETGRSFYPPTMGVSEHIAAIEFHGEFETDRVDAQDGTVSVDSALPDAGTATIPQSGVTYNVERVPGFMEADESGRRTTGYVDYTFTEAAAIEARVSGFSPVETDGRTVVFA